MLRQHTIAFVIAALVGGLPIVETASAAVIGDCTLTGYTFMGGGSAYTSTPGGPSGQKDYFLGQPLNFDYGGANYYGYGWAKFDVGTTTVGSAYLTYDLLGAGGMGTTPASPTNPAYLHLYDPGSHDVAGLGGADPTPRDALQGYLDGQTPLHNVTMTSNGLYSLDITDLYNDWVTGDKDNHGLVFSAPDDTGNAGKYASFGHATGSAPYISNSAVPEPSTLTVFLTGCGTLVCGSVLRRARRKRRADRQARGAAKDVQQ
jgi:hypothetical protein